MKKICGKQIKFCRYGGLSPVIQKGYKETKDDPTFHSPPARRGIYAFVWPYIEVFLLTNSFGEIKWIKSDELNEYGDPLEKLIKPRIFVYTGELWHHLEKWCHGGDIIKKHGGWVKTTFEVYVEALRKEFHSLKEGGCWYMGENDKPFKKINNPTTYTCKDHLEVFIERIK